MNLFTPVFQIVQNLTNVISVLAAWVEQQKFTSSEIQTEDRFGNSVDISADGTRIIVSAYQEDGGAGDPLDRAGAAYVFSYSNGTWTEEQILRASDAQAVAFFGEVVAISGDGIRVAVCAKSENTGASNSVTNGGAVYVFSRSGTTWTEEQVLTPGDPTANGYFGVDASFSNDGSRLIVAPQGAHSGVYAAYVFSRSGTTWSQEQKITEAGAANGFGRSVSMSNDGSRVVISDYQDTSNTGAAYVFSRSGTTWSKEQKITPSDGQTDDYFGQNVSIDGNGDRVIVSSAIEDGGAGDPLSNAGAAYVFSRSGTTWTEEQKLTASDAQANDRFSDGGVKISNDGTKAIVGTKEEDGGPGDPLSGAGAAYVFSRSGTTWTEEKKLIPSDIQANDSFGDSVSISGDGTKVAVGAPTENGGAGDPITNSGAVYVFENA